MRKIITTGVVAAALFTVNGGQALADPADQGNCISSRDNGGAAGDRVSSAAGPGFGPAVAQAIGGGAIGSTASDPGCRRSEP